MNEVDNRLSGESSSSFVVVCVSHELDKTFPRGVLNVQWQRRLITEVVYVPASQDRSDDDFFSGISFVRVFAERRLSKEWEFDTSYAVRWVPVATDANFPNILAEALSVDVHEDPDSVEVSITAVQGAQ